MTGDSTHPFHTPEAICDYNAAALNELRRAISLRPHRFSLVLARCNYGRLREILLAPFRQEKTAQILELTHQVMTLRHAIAIGMTQAAPTALMVTGLENVQDSIAVLKAANLARDEFGKSFPFPLVLWVNDRILQEMNRHAPDFKSFATAPISFTYPPGELVYSLHQSSNELFAAMLSLGDDSPYPGQAPAYRQGSTLRNELEFALKDIAQQDGYLDAELKASLDFLKGRDAFSRGDLDVARYHFNRSLHYWQLQSPALQGPLSTGTLADYAPLPPSSPLPQSPSSLQSPPPTPREKQAVLLFYLGATWRSQAAIQRILYQPSLAKARQSFEACLYHFRQEHRSDLEGKFLHALAEVLQKLQDWSALEDLAYAGLDLHRHDPVRLARDHGYLAEVALARGENDQAQTQANRALEILKIASAVHAPAPARRHPLPLGLEVAHRFQRGWYLYLLARVQIAQAHPELAISLLKEAHQQTSPQVDLTLYRNILETLREQYYAQKDYRAAFHVKLEQRRVETHFKLRAFIGAGQIQPYESPLAVVADGPTQAVLATEIEASGRQTEVTTLVERLEVPRYQLLVIHGPSGVGKSSILYAGLVPALWKSFPEGRSTLPVLVKTYRDWPDAVSQALDLALQQQQQSTTTEDLIPSAAAVDRYGLMARLKGLIQKHFLQIVLVFDQFEEFFTEATELRDRKEFYAFLTECLNTPFLKVVLALREDYLHYLLEAERMFDLDIINNDILSRDIRYYLGNFTPDQAEEVVRRLTTRAQFYLEEALIKLFVEDLAGDLGEVRPIELQVVGAQLQRNDINTLEEYQELGNHPKETLVQRFLENVVNDCGAENTPLAYQVLSILTEEDRDGRLYRPQKRREEIEEALMLQNYPFEREQLDLVLEILVGSGLVFNLPEILEERYQLVHDYLMKYVRQEQGNRSVRATPYGA